MQIQQLYDHPFLSILKGYFNCIVFFLIFLTAGCNESQPDKLTIAAAANMQFVIQDLVSAFQTESGVPCQIITSSSGKLTAQIKEGAPFDIFLSADVKFPEDIFIAGLAIGPPKIYGYGHLVLWTLDKDIVLSMEILKSEKIRRIAMANPKTAPYGQAAMEVLHHYQLWEDVKGKIVYGESISQTNQFIMSKAATIGFTSKSIVLTDILGGTGRWIEIDTNSYSPIPQARVLLKNERNKEAAAKKFDDFLFSKEGRAIMTKYGYTF